jgi:hypothetical protein
MREIENMEKKQKQMYSKMYERVSESLGMHFNEGLSKVSSDLENKRIQDAI